MNNAYIFPIGTRVKRNPKHFNRANINELKALDFRGEVIALENNDNQTWHRVKWDNVDYSGWQKPSGYFYDELLHENEDHKE